MALGFFPYEPLHYKAAQAYLDKKAAKGLELRKIYLGCIARFEKAKHPRHFVDLDLDKKRYNDPDRSYKDYFRLCADGGWLYVQTLRGMLLFRADPSKDPTPIQTDENVEFDRFWEKNHPRLWKSFLPAALLALALFCLIHYTADYFCASDLLTTNLGLSCLLLFALTLLLLPIVFISSRLYLSKCRKSGQIEPVDRASVMADIFTQWHRILSALIALSLLLGLIYSSHPRHSLREYLSYHSNPQSEVSDPSTLEALTGYPVLTIQGLDLPDSFIDSEYVLGNRSLLVRHFRQLEVFYVEGKLYRIATDHYQCATPAVARLLLALRLRDARNTDSPIWSADWEPIALPGLEECYISYANGHSEYGYLLFRQGNVVAMTGCFDGHSRPLDMTTPEALDFIRSRLLP